MEEKPKEEVIVLNSEDEDYSDLPACGTTGDPAHKVKVASSEKKQKKNANECCTSIKCDTPSVPCPCEEKKVNDEKEETKELDEATKKDEEDKLVAEIKDDKKAKSVCYKCKLLPAQYKYRQEFACKGCMESNLEHKLKSNLKLRVGLERNEKMLVCISGGSNSLVMGQLVSNALYNLSGKKMFFTAELLHIDQSEIYEQDEDTILRNQQIITKISERLKIKLNVVRLSSIFSSNNGTTIDETEEKQNKAKLLELLSKFKATGSCREDIVQAMKTQLIMNYAFNQHYDKVLLGSSGQRLASKIFALFAKGRAVAADNEINYADKIQYDDLATFFDFDTKSGEVSYPKKQLVVGRPMKDFLNKDILNYTHSQELLPLIIAQTKYLCETEKANLKLPGNGNIDWIMEDFIDNIQENFVSTTHTILHTSEKIIKKQKPFEGIAARCPLCFQYRDVINNPLETETYDSLNKQIDEMKGKDPRETTLCFGCTRIFQNRNDPKFNVFESDLLPKSIVSRAQRILDFVPSGVEDIVQQKEEEEQGKEKLEDVPTA